MKKSFMAVIMLLTLLMLPAACRKATPASVSATPESKVAPPGSPSAILEPRVLELDWPAVVRRGDTAIVRLTFRLDPGGETLHVDSGGIVLDYPLGDAFASQRVIAQAELDLPQMVVQPPGLVSQALLPGQEISFRWYIRTSTAGHYSGTVWFSLVFISTEGSGSLAEATYSLPVAAIPMELDVNSLAGLSGGTGRILGWISLFIGSILLLPLLLDRLTQGVQEDKNTD